MFLAGSPRPDGWKYSDEWQQRAFNPAVGSLNTLMTTGCGENLKHEAFARKFWGSDPGDVK